MAQRPAAIQDLRPYDNYQNTLDPAITGNTAGQLFQVTTRPGFSISGTAAAQGAGYPGGFSQVFQVGRNSIPTWSSVQQIPYSGVTP